MANRASHHTRQRGRIATWVALAVVGALTLASPPGALAQAAGDEQTGIHWAFGSLLGTGAYRVSSERTALVIDIPARWVISRSKYGAQGERRIGLELRVPVGLGILKGNKVGDFADQDVYGTVSIMPGLLAEIPVTRSWLLRPYFAVGWGSELGPARIPDFTDPENPIIYDNDWAIIYQTGLKSRVALPFEVGNWGLLGALQYAGYNPDVGPSADLLLVMGGLETRQRLGSLMNGNHALFIESHATYSYVTDLAKLRNGIGRPLGIDDFWEVGLAVSQGVVPFRILGIPIERLGLAFQMSTDRQFRGMKLSFRSPFRR